jgi:hypothetical protein
MLGATLRLPLAELTTLTFTGRCSRSRSRR